MTTFTKPPRTLRFALRFFQGAALRRGEGKWVRNGVNNWINSERFRSYPSRAGVSRIITCITPQSAGANARPQPVGYVTADRLRAASGCEPLAKKQVYDRVGSATPCARGRRVAGHERLSPCSGHGGFRHAASGACFSPAGPLLRIGEDAFY